MSRPRNVLKQARPLELSLQAPEGLCTVIQLQHYSILVKACSRVEVQLTVPKKTVSVNVKSMLAMLLKLYVELCEDKWMLSNPAPRWLVFTPLQGGTLMQHLWWTYMREHTINKVDWVCDGIGTKTTLSSLFWGAPSRRCKVTMRQAKFACLWWTSSKAVSQRTPCNSSMTTRTSVSLYEYHTRTNRASATYDHHIIAEAGKWLFLWQGRQGHQY